MEPRRSGLTLRWSVTRAVLDPVQGREQAGGRPVLIISNEAFNRATTLATIVPLTTARRDPQPWEILLPPDAAGLAIASLALIPQLRIIAQDRFRFPVYGRLTDILLRRRIAELVIEHFDFDDLEALDLEP